MLAVMTLYFPELQHERAGSDRCERFGFAQPMHTRAAVGQLLQGGGGDAFLASVVACSW
ncbi:hypothetical protein HMPREF9579_02110 [Cutibacterium acnes HL087PA1]|nr:hypothetical protein HMPREF9579_02110 [Cutibacterium acnes HL087PA1]